MLSGNYNYQFIDWSHDAILNTEGGPAGDDHAHLGTMSTHLITPTITIGLSDYVNISYQQAIGVRSMDWMGEGDSNHHRDENSLSEFTNALGSTFGDATINLKYLLTNTGMQNGSRIFVGGALIIPSNSVLTKNPFIDENPEDNITDEEHRHFSLSDGCYKTNLELQYYIKRNAKNWFEPAFFGITFNYIKAIEESKYGYLPGATYIGVGSLLFATKLKNTWAPKGVSLGLSYLSTEKGFWNDELAPNSEAKLFIPSLGIIWNHKKYGSISLNLKYIENKSIIPEDAPNGDVQAFEMSIGYRKTLNYTIPWLYF